LHWLLLAFFLDVERVGPVEQSDSPLGIVMDEDETANPEAYGYTRQAESHKNFYQDFPAFPAKREALVLMLAKLI
jgi:hypothetical protein